MQPSRSYRWVVFLLLWLALLACAFYFDRAIAERVQHAHPLGKLSKTGRTLLRLPGIFYFTIIIALLLGILHPRRWAAALALLASGAAGGAVYSVIKWLTGRHRPKVGIAPFSFHPFPGGIIGLFHAEKALCFPSGDATLAFATAASIALLAPRWAALFYAWAVVVAAERVLENAHYLSDVTAGAGLGILIGTLVTQAVMSLLRKSEAPLGPLSNSQERP